MMNFGVILFPACVESIGGSNATVKGQILGQKMLVHGHMNLMRAKVSW